MNNNCLTGNSVITDQEKELIAKLKERVQEKLPEPIKCYSKADQNLYLVRWLRGVYKITFGLIARDLDLEKATNMLETTIEWRKEHNVENALNFKIHPFFKTNYPYECLETDKFGQPIWLMPLAEWDMRKVVNDSDRLLEFDQFVTHFFETVTAKIRELHLKSLEAGKGPVTQVTIIVDVKNYSYMQLVNFGAMKKLLHMAAQYEKNFPEILYRCIFVNCPSFFGMFIAMLKPVLAPKTLGKITCYPQISEWQQKMDELVDKNILPERYGGTKPN